MNENSLLPNNEILDEIEFDVESRLSGTSKCATTKQFFANNDASTHFQGYSQVV
jgi:hypothetical protein